jgi:signal transduction histidine kinase
MVTLPFIVDQWYALPAKAPPAGHPAQSVPLGLWLIEIVLSVGFGASFWWNTRTVGCEKLSKTGFVLLVFQMALCTFTPELGFILAAELPLMMPVRQGLKWLIAQAIALLALTATAVVAGDFVPTETLAHAPLAISVPGTVLYMLAWMSFAFGAAYLAASETRSLRKLALVNAELLAAQELLTDSARSAERLRVSRELHDVMGHHLAGLSVNLQLATHLVREPEAQRPVREAHLVAKLLLAEVRSVVSALREPRQTNLRHVLQLLAGGVTEPRIHLDLPDELDSFDPECAHVCFRCVQEAITNAIKHAGARNLWVTLKHAGTGWDLDVRDDGRGVAAIVPGNGLKGMAERLAQVGGSLIIESRSGEGFLLHACIPAPGTTS